MLFRSVAELDLILRKNKEARSLDVDHFHDIFRTDNDDQILKVLKLSVTSGNRIMNIQPLASDTWGSKETAFASHYCIASGVISCDLEIICSLFLTVNYSVLGQSLTTATPSLNVNFLIEQYELSKLSPFRRLKIPFQ